MGSDTTVTSIALSNTTIGDLSVVSGKALFSALVWKTTSSTLGVNKQFGFYLTTNATVPTHDIGSSSAYNPKDDPSVSLVQEFHCSGSCNSATDLMNSGLSLLKTLANGESIIKEDHGCPSGSPYMCGSTTFNPAQSLGNLHQFFLNFTGAVNGSACGVSTGAGCSFLDLNGAQVTSSNTLPWFQFQAQQYYIGFYVMPGLGAEVYFTFDTGSGANNLQYYVNAPPTTLPPQIDTGGFFGPIIKALIGLGVFILNAILGFIAFIAPAIQSAIAFLETLIQNILNFIGNALGFGNVGTQLFTFLGQVVTFFTSFLPNSLTNFPTFMSRFFDYLNIVFPILPSAFATALTVLTFGVNAISQALTIFIFSIQFITAAYAFFLIFSFMVFTADDALGGVVEYLGTAEALAFFLIKWAALLTNLGLDIGTWIIGLIPKPFIQMAAARLPRIPILESSARIILPSFDFGELRSGNLLSPWLWTLGLWFDTWYESRNPALPGSLCQLVSGTCTNMQQLSNLLPLMQVFVFMSSGVLALWLVMRPLELLGADLGIFESIGVGLGRKPVGGPGGITLAKSQKHFQGRLQKAVEKQKGVQGFKAVGPFSSGAKLEKGVGTKETVSTASLFE